MKIVVVLDYETGARQSLCLTPECIVEPVEFPAAKPYGGAVRIRTVSEQTVFDVLDFPAERDASRHVGLTFPSDEILLAGQIFETDDMDGWGEDGPTVSAPESVHRVQARNKQTGAIRYFFHFMLETVSEA